MLKMRGGRKKIKREGEGAVVKEIARFCYWPCVSLPREGEVRIEVHVQLNRLCFSQLQGAPCCWVAVTQTAGLQGAWSRVQTDAWLPSWRHLTLKNKQANDNPERVGTQRTSILV